jgi:glycosyltransferase involved in cell wall biosynthesis
MGMMGLRGVTFVGLSGYRLPHTRVRCYHFAKALGARGFRTRVYSFKDRLKQNAQESVMYGLSDREKFQLIVRAIPSLAHQPGDLLYVQKAHYHAASVLALHKVLGRSFVLDYDDYEVGADPFGVPLHCGFARPWLQRLALGAERDLDLTLGLARTARGCVVASRSIERFLAPYAKRIIYLPTGADVSRFRPAEVVCGEPVFVWTGLVWGQTVFEGVRLLVDAFKVVRGEVGTARLVIIGGGTWMCRLKEVAGSVDGVTFAGEIAPDAMPAALAEASIGVSPPMRECSWTVSKSPTKLFEYMATGLAVVAWSGGEARDVVSHGAHGLLVHNGRGMTEAMLALAKDVPRRRQLGAAARNRIVSCYSLDVLTTRLASFLEALGVRRV